MFRFLMDHAPTGNGAFSSEVDGKGPTVAFDRRGSIFLSRVRVAAVIAGHTWYLRRRIAVYFDCLAMIMSLILLYVACGMTFLDTN